MQKDIQIFCRIEGVPVVVITHSNQKQLRGEKNLLDIMSRSQSVMREVRRELNQGLRSHEGLLPSDLLACVSCLP